ncbi:cupin domain-containing protein [Haloferula sp.]|uniref:cupin domain-containing protein n=1 Tax=Haloferula sp. TaxID=2497595 RepID=UPI00329AB890
MKTDTPRETLDWGNLGWLSHPPATGNKNLTVIDVEVKPGMGHDFHRHPDQEEVIYCIKGQVEQWIEQEKRILGPGDAVYIDADVVHASFNVGSEPAHLIAILGPCVGEEGYEVVEMAEEAPWNSLRD